MPTKKVSRALISVSDKTGIIELASVLAANKIEIIASDGSAALLRSSGIAVRTVTEVTGSPEILNGKVKTLHPAIHAALLVDQDDPKQLAELTLLPPIDLLVINLYPTSGFDIGGPALARAAAKNARHVAVISHPTQYPDLIQSLTVGTSDEQRKQWAVQALLMTAQYDLSLIQTHAPTLRYGENPQQSAVLAAVNPPQVLQGKEMSYNNYLDLDAAIRAVNFCGSAFAIVKHGVPSAIAHGTRASETFLRAWSSDPISSFGGVVATNLVIDEECATQIVKEFVEVVCAPDFTSEALQVLMSKPRLRVVKHSLSQTSNLEFRSIQDGLLVQQSDNLSNPEDEFANWKLVCGPALEGQSKTDLIFAWSAAAAARSNAVVIAKDLQTIGIGAGSVNRLDAAKLAIERARQHHASQLANSVAASDAFFPFPDGVEALISAGVIAIAQPGGSIKDEVVISAAQKAGITMYFTGIRHFSH